MWILTQLQSLVEDVPVALIVGGVLLLLAGTAFAGLVWIITDYLLTYVDEDEPSEAPEFWAEVAAANAECDQLLDTIYAVRDEDNFKEADCSLGSKTIIFISGSFSKVFKISWRTSPQFNPPNPQPKGGMAID